MSGIDHAELARLHPLSFGWARSCCRFNDDEAEAVLQDAYLKTLDGSARFDGRAALKTWFFAVIRTTAQEHARRARRREMLQALFARERLVDADASPSAPFDEHRDLEAALCALSPRQQDLVHLVFYQDLSIAEAAKVIGVSLGSARTHYTRGVAALRERLSTQASA